MVIQQRILYIDYMKALAMILVVMGHVNFANEPVKAWIYSFHMPTFFFCSGLLLNWGGGQIWLRAQISKKFQRLMIPYLLWALIYAKFSFPNLGKILYGSYWSIVSAGALSSLWFLPVMFVALVMFYAICSIAKAKISSPIIRIGIAVMALLVGFMLHHFRFGYPWAVNVAFIALAFMIMGSVVSKYVTRIYHYLVSLRDANRHSLFPIVVCLSISIFMFAITMLYPYINPDAGYVLMANARCGNLFMFVTVALCGALMLLSFSVHLDLFFSGEIRWLSFIGRNTICIFAVQKPIIGIFMIIFRHIEIMPWPIILTVTTVATLILSGVTSMVINKYVPILAGK